MAFLTEPIQSLLFFLSHFLGDSLGLGIVALTLVTKAITIPLVLPALKSQQQIKKLQPELTKLKKNHSKDKKALAEAQLKLYQRHGINPTAGCLPQIVNLILIFALYRALINVLNAPDLQLETYFLWFDLLVPDKIYLLSILTGLTQLVLAFMLKPALVSKPKSVSKGKAEDPQDPMEMAQQVQGQMFYLMPVMIVVISLRFPSGLALYWVISNLFQIIQQYFISGPGGLDKIFLWLKRK